MATHSLVLRSNWSIYLDSDNPVAQLAATELRRTLQRIGAPPLALVAQAVAPCITLSHGDNGDGFRRTVDDAGLKIQGDGPRGLLYGVYDLLETLGCQWVQPGYDGELLPRYERVELPSAEVAQQPAFPGRCLIIGHDFFLPQADEWIVWSARNRLNTIFIHTIDEPLAFGACHLSAWETARTTLLPLLRERGMTLELGGHGMAALVPRALFKTVPDAFRHNGERRTPDHNFCPTSPEAQALLRRNGRTFFEAHPEADIIHLWPDDILGNGWCRCERCGALSPSDQALLATNVLAETLAAVRPSAQIAYLAYHDTLPAPTQVRPHSNVVLAFAPRMRSYGQSFGDATSGVNQEQARALEANRAWFPQSDDPSRPGSRVFEYYLDGILFKSAPPPLLHTLPDDLRTYRVVGVHTVQALMVNDRPWLVPPLNAYLFARLLWNPDHSADDLLASYAAARAPHAPDALAAAYRALAGAWQPALALVPGESGAQPHGSALANTEPVAAPLLQHYGPHSDVLDYMNAPKAVRERRLELIDRALPLLDTGRTAWDVLLAKATIGKKSLESERQEWELGARQLFFVSKRQRLYVLAGRKAPAPLLRDALGEAQAALDQLQEWGRTNLPDPHARATFAFMHEFSQLQLDALRGRALLGFLGRFWLRLVAYRRLATLLARVRLKS